MSRLYLLILLLLSGFAPGAGTATLPDPTRPPDYTPNPFIVEPEQQEETDFNLTAVRIDETSRSVIINGKLLREGDRIESAQILEIHPAHVILDYEDKRLVVRLYSSFSKTTSDSRNKMKITN